MCRVSLGMENLRCDREYSSCDDKNNYCDDRTATRRLGHFSFPITRLMIITNNCDMPPDFYEVGNVVKCAVFHQVRRNYVPIAKIQSVCRKT